VFNHHYEDLYVYPWEKKRPKAMMRASQQGCMPANSSRCVGVVYVTLLLLVLTG
jgi:hypothetical protein